jgi:hypothetical protein
MSRGRRRESERAYPHSDVYWVSGEKEERGDDLVGRKSGGSGGGEREEAPSGTRVLSLPESSMSKPGEEKEKGNWSLGNEGFRVSFGQRFSGRRKRVGYGR